MFSWWYVDGENMRKEGGERGGGEERKRENQEEGEVKRIKSIYLSTVVRYL